MKVVLTQARDQLYHFDASILGKLIFLSNSVAQTMSFK